MFQGWRALAEESCSGHSGQAGSRARPARLWALVARVFQLDLTPNNLSTASPQPSHLSSTPGFEGRFKAHSCFPFTSELPAVWVDSVRFLFLCVRMAG